MSDAKTDDRLDSGIARRAVIGALALTTAVALQPGCASADTSSRDTYVDPVKELLLSISGGRLAAYLQKTKGKCPTIAGLEDERGVSLLEKLRGVPLLITPGVYLIRAAQKQMDVLLPQAEKATGGRIGAARFIFAEESGVISLRAALFGPLIGHALHTPSGGSIKPAMSAQQVQDAYDRLVAEGGGTLFFPAGTYRISLILTDRSVRVAGEGMGATVLMPATPDRPVIEAAYRSGSWSTVEIADLSIVGNGQGDGFRAGHMPRQLHDEFSGRTRFRNVRFSGLYKCISRPYGQIGLWLENCIFEGAEYHLHSIGTLVPGEAMHAGNVLARDCYFSGARKAVFLMKSGVTGTGQITFDRCIMELNEGYVFYVDTMNGVDGVPGMLVRSCWNEANGTGKSVTIDRSEIPVYAYFKDASLVRFEDTPLGDLTLVNATVETEDCSLDRLTSVKADKSSTLVHRDARGFGGFSPKGVVESVSASYQFGPNRALSFAMPVRRERNHEAGKGFSVLTQEIWHPGAIVRIGIASGERKRLLSPVVVPKDCWMAWACECRHVSGSFAALSILGTGGISAPFMLDHDVMRNVAGLSWCAAMTDVHVELSSSGRKQSVVDVGQVQIVSFERRQDALAYLNSHAFISA